MIICTDVDCHLLYGKTSCILMLSMLVDHVGEVKPPKKMHFTFTRTQALPVRITVRVNV